MMFKLAVQNVRRSARDYLVYFFTMAVVTALMFSFNTLLFSRDLLNMFETAGIMEVMITVFYFPRISENGLIWLELWRL